MGKSLTYARTHTKIEDEEVNLIMACRRNILFDNGKTWTKKNKNFDVTMGAQDGAEIAELTGIFLLKQVDNFLSSLGEKAHAGLYRDDGLIYIENAKGPLLNKIEKALHRIFKSNSLKISIEQKGHSVNFFDVTLETDGSYKSYRKPDGTTKYVNKASNHPSSILKNIPASIQRRLNSISSSEDMFGGAKDECEKALKDAEYAETLQYDSEVTRGCRPKRKRSRHIIWFNPPYSKSVATNIGKEFFKLLRVHFPKQHPLYHIFKDNTVKLSYSCMPNMDNVVKAHNSKLLRNVENPQTTDQRSCNCRDKAKCPVGNNCLQANVVYKATVQHESKTSTYIGMTENTFKTRYTLYKSSQKHNKNRSQTELSNLVWSLKDNNIPYELTWEIIIDRMQPYRPGKRTCNLCLAEKFYILKGEHLINKKTELLNKCPHRRKFLACNLKP